MLLNEIFRLQLQMKLTKILKPVGQTSIFVKFKKLINDPPFSVYAVLFFSIQARTHFSNVTLL